MNTDYFLPNEAITDNAKYERNASAFFDANNTLWVFYARADTLTHRTGSDVDNESYMIYYMTSTDKGTTWSSPTLLDKTRPTGFNQRDISAMVVSGQLVVFASSGDSGTYRPLIKYVSSDGGTTWSDAVSITIPGEPVDGNNPLGGTRLGHSHVVYASNKYHLVFQSSGGSVVKYASSTDAVTWTAATTVYASAHYVPKLLVDADGSFYLVTAKGADGEIWLAKSADGVTWTTAHVLGSESAWGDWDPFIARLPYGPLAIVWAPNVGSDGQQLKASTSRDNGATWTTPIDFTDGQAGSEEWWDYWPQILTTEQRTMIFYTSERDAAFPVFNGGNVWLFPQTPERVETPAPIFAMVREIDGINIYDRFIG